uniref:Presenilin n=1 Tax=Amphora coffeiformis TaxID=265554 RepID=A0A7S3P6F6_9STRA|mmetsp:Transcript_12372/g.23663  ORF Transcript_12372/g.23663 Transcript_12372/m.23663 type:complete len:587 (-) Transcript_12372:107-1867(-)
MATPVATVDSIDEPTDRYGSVQDSRTQDYEGNQDNAILMQDTNLEQPSVKGSAGGGEFFHDEAGDDEEGYDDDDDEDEESQEEFGMSIQELLYSSSSYYAIAKPVTITMILAALAVVVVNTQQTIEAGEEAMSQAYQVWQVDSASSSNGENLARSLGNAAIMIGVIGGMTFVIVFLYKMRFMMCLIGYMIVCSGTLLGILGGNMVQTFLMIYDIPLDKVTFALVMFNFAIVGVLAIFWGEGVPKYITQGYLVCTSVILAWHLSYFDVWTTWALLFMLALYDLCAVLTPCGPLKALVNAMSEEGAPEMPGLLFEAELPPEAKRPTTPSATTPRASSGTAAGSRAPSSTAGSRNRAGKSEGAPPVQGSQAAPPNSNISPVIDVPLAIAKVYNLDVIGLPIESKEIMFPNKARTAAAAPLLQDSVDGRVDLPEEPSVRQLRAMVTVRLPQNGGRLERVKKRGKRVFLERDRHGDPKRILWVDRAGKVFAEMRDDDENAVQRNTIRLGLGDFIFYSVLVAKAAQYSFATFAACMLVVLAGLGGTLILLAVYHHALPALPISILMGIVIYLTTRLFLEPFVEQVLRAPYYV